MTDRQTREVKIRVAKAERSRTNRQTRKVKIRVAKAERPRTNKLYCPHIWVPVPEDWGNQNLTSKLRQLIETDTLRPNNSLTPCLTPPIFTTIVAPIPPYLGKSTCRASAAL